MGERGLQIKADINKEGWESSDFPLVCETCLGDNPYVRMTKDPHGKACKICDRPFTIFRWRPGAKARFKKTEVCQTCAKMKNICQTCVLDLTYGLPVQVRDSILAEAAAEGGGGGAASLTMTVPQSDTNKQWFAGQHDRMVAEGVAESYGKAAVNEKLLRMARSQPYYKRNLPHKCSFYAKGECTRGDKCPFLHEMPTSREDPLAVQNIKDRFYGQDDPVALKMLKKATQKEETRPLIPPQDPTIQTLMVGMEELPGGAVGEDDLRDVFSAYGDLANLRMVVTSKIAFVEFSHRAGAEAAAGALNNNFTCKGHRLRLSWAFRPTGPPPGYTGAAAGAAGAALGAPGSAAAPLPHSLPPPSLGGGGRGPPPPSYLPPPPHHHHHHPPPPNYPPPPQGGASHPLPPPQLMNFVPAPPPPTWTPGTVPPPPPGGPPQGQYVPPQQQAYYPSMDPQRMGARPPPPPPAPPTGPPPHHQQQRG